MSYYSIYIVLISIYIAFRAFVAWYGVYRVDKDLRNSPSKGERERYNRERSSNLTLAGFSLSALTFILTLAPNRSDDTNTNEETLISLPLQETMIFLSISLVCFIVASYLLQLKTRKIYAYTADSLEFLGLISIGAAMLSFFFSNFAQTSDTTVIMIYWDLFGLIPTDAATPLTTVIYSVFFGVLTLISMYNTYKSFDEFREKKAEATGKKAEATGKKAEATIAVHIVGPSRDIYASNKVILRATFSIAKWQVQKKPTRAFLVSSGGNYSLCNNSGTSFAKPSLLAPLAGEPKNVGESGNCSSDANSWTCNADLGPPAPIERGDKVISSITYENVVLLIQQDSADILTSNYGKVKASLRLITDKEVYPRGAIQIKYSIENAGNQSLIFPDEINVTKELKKFYGSDIVRWDPTSEKMGELKPGVQRNISRTLGIDRKRHSEGKYSLTVSLGAFCASTTIELSDKP